MDFNDTPDQAKFRAKCKEWLDSNAQLKDTGKRANVETSLEELIAKAKVWQKKKYDAGWAMLHWPKEYGGICLLYTSPSPRDQRGSRMPSSA